MRHLFIINPAAGSRDRTEDYRRAILAAKPEGEIVVSRGPGDCKALAAAAAAQGEPVRIYACGGDGTLNEVVAGAAGWPNAAVTAYPGGSGNDFVKIFSDPAAFSDLNRLLDAQETEFDLIDCNGDLSLNICSVGLDARISADVAGYKRIPLLNGFRAYLASLVVNLFRGISEHYVVQINGETIDQELTFVCVCNGRHYGGGFHPMPDADPRDGMLDVLLVKKVRLWEVVKVIGKYQSGQYRALSDFIRYYPAKQLRVHCDRPSSINLDGEVRWAQDVHFQIADKKIRFFYPRGLTF